jgi:hypothetical protein
VAHKLFVLFIRYNWNYQVEEDEMDRVCIMHVSEEDCLQGFGGEARRREATEKI